MRLKTAMAAQFVLEENIAHASFKIFSTFAVAAAQK